MIAEEFWRFEAQGPGVRRLGIAGSDQGRLHPKFEVFLSGAASALLHPILGSCDLLRLPLHVGRVVCAATLEGLDVINDKAGAPTADPAR